MKTTGVLKHAPDAQWLSSYLMMSVYQVYINPMSTANAVYLLLSGSIQLSARQTD